MAGQTYDWNLARCSFLINGLPLDGFGEDDTFLFAPNADNYEYMTGAEGNATRSKTNDRGGEMTFTLMQTSPANAVLGAFQALTELGLRDVFSVFVTNLNTGESVQAAVAWVNRPPDLGMGKTARTNEWIVRSGNIRVNRGTGSVLF